jgi:hypothetical protein
MEPPEMVIGDCDWKSAQNAKPETVESKKKNFIFTTGNMGGAQEMNRDDQP